MRRSPAFGTTLLHRLHSLFEKYLLDSSPLAGYLNGRPAFVSALSPLIRQGEATTSILVYAELTEYLRGLPDGDRLRDQLRWILRAIYPYFPTYRIAERYADIRRSLRLPYGPGLIGDIDTLIAATALEYKHILITTDTDFQRVPGLALRLLPRHG